MIPEIINKWEDNKHLLEEYFKTNIQVTYCNSYEDILKVVIEHVLNKDDDSFYDTEEITVIDNGDYQGTLIFIFHKKTYQPYIGDYLVTYVGYGSCSGCDTLLGISGYSYKSLPTEEQVKDYMTLSLHLIQKMKTLI